jgi:hypothetical protein
MTAIEFIDEIKARGYSVPGDFSVCGFDNIFPPRLDAAINHHRPPSAGALQGPPWSNHRARGES